MSDEWLKAFNFVQQYVVLVQLGFGIPEPESDYSDESWGAMFTRATMVDTQRRFLLSCGEGLSSQNSKRIHVGLGETKLIDSIEVSWPSGKKTIRENVKAGRIKGVSDEWHCRLLIESFVAQRLY